MSVQTFLLSAFKKSLATLGAEEITIGSTKIQASEDETASSNALGRAATNNERTLAVKFPSDAYSGALKSGMKVMARGQAEVRVGGRPFTIRRSFLEDLAAQD